MRPTVPAIGCRSGPTETAGPAPPRGPRQRWERCGRSVTAPSLRLPPSPQPQRRQRRAACFVGKAPPRKKMSACVRACVCVCVRVCACVLAYLEDSAHHHVLAPAHEEREDNPRRQRRPLRCRCKHAADKFRRNVYTCLCVSIYTHICICISVCVLIDRKTDRQIDR